MPHYLKEDVEFLTHAFNAIPFPILIVDDDLRILSWNSSALRLLGSEEILHQRGGEALHCLHSQEVEKGCGYGPHCKTCVVLNSVHEANRGEKVYRNKTVMKLQRGDTFSDIPLLVTASPFLYKQQSLTLLILEDIHELMELGSLLPICANCKKIRSSTNEWQAIEGYIKNHIVDVDFTHGLCPECLTDLYPNIAKLSAE